MIGKADIPRLLAGFVACSVTACATVDIGHYCQYSHADSIRQADASSLSLILGAPPARSMETPLVVFYSPSQLEPERSVSLTARRQPHALPASLDESRCANVDWNTYSLTVDADRWEAFWKDDRTVEFEVGIGFLEDERPLRLDSFGAALVDSASAQYLVSCGCYWE